MSAPPARRKLGLFDATMLVMGGIIGVGIFFTPGHVAELVPHPGAFFVMWVLGAGVALCGAATFAELGGTFPRNGGWFEFLREIYGPFVSFLFAWVILGVVATGAIAVVASFGASMVLGLFGLESEVLHLALAAGVLLGLTVLTMFGVKVGATFQNACMVAKLTAMAALVVGGVVFFTPGESQPLVVEAAGSFSWSGMVAASLPVLFAFGGWQHVCYIADEVKEPQRNVPRAILLGVAGVGVTYLLINLAYMRVLGPEGLATTEDFAAVVAGEAFGARGARALQAAMAVSAIGLCAVNVIVNPTIFVAMSRSGLFFRSFGRLHARTGAPILALVTQLVLALGYLAWAHADAFVEVSEEAMDIDVLTGSVVFAEWVFHGLVAWGLIQLRRRHADLPRPYRSFAFPLAPGLYLAAALMVVVGNLATAPGLTTGVGLGVLALGALLYPSWRRLFRSAGPLD